MDGERKRRPDAEPAEVEETHAERSTPAPGAATETYVTAVERHSKSPHRYRVFLNGEFAFSVHEDVLVKHRLLKGERVESDKLRAVLEDEEQQKAWSDALKYIGRRPRSEKEVRQYLQRKGISRPLADQIVERLEGQGYIDDADFAAIWTEQRIVSHKKGRRWVKQELRQKGVAAETIRQALDRIDPEQELELACELARKRWKMLSGAPNEKWRKTAAYLLRRGYPASIVSQALRGMAGSGCDDSFDETFGESGMSGDVDA